MWVHRGSLPREVGAHLLGRYNLDFLAHNRRRVQSVLALSVSLSSWEWIGT